MPNKPLQAHLLDTATLFSLSYLCVSLFKVGTQGVVLAKTKTPLFSLGSQGSLANTLTTQKGSSSSILRRKPTPSDPYSLPQAYQRWLYEDYAYLWTQQSAATQAQYRSAGVRHHLTGFQYWMSVMLATLPDIAGWWPLDYISAGTTLDRSKNLNHGTIIGPSIVPGVIDHGMIFDGINDEVDCGLSPELDITEFSIIAFIEPFDLTARYGILSKRAGTFGIDIEYRGDLGKTISLFTGDGFWWSLHDSNINAITTPGYHCIGINYTNVTRTSTFYVDGEPWGDDLWAHDLLPSVASSFILGIAPVAWLKGNLDNIIIYNRLLDATEHKRWSERRYPS
ncbi:hypothetical protein ES703_105775 [subsurface metagenome]